MTTKNNLKNSENHLWGLIHWHPTSKQMEQFLRLQEEIKYLNKEVNLTRLIEGDDYWINQIFDSLWPLKKELQSPLLSRKCIDVGTGCGLPGLAVAIALPGADLTLVDGTSRKTLAVKQIVSRLDLSSRIKVLTERIELTGQNHLYRGKFDLAMARAVANAPIVAEYLIPLLKNSGEALVFRGKWTQSDERELNHALALLNAKIKEVNRIELPSNRGIRHVIRIQGVDTCPNKYPRSIGTPKRKPL